MTLSLAWLNCWSWYCTLQAVVSTCSFTSTRTSYSTSQHYAAQPVVGHHPMQWFWHLGWLASRLDLFEADHAPSPPGPLCWMPLRWCDCCESQITPCLMMSHVLTHVTWVLFLVRWTDCVFATLVSASAFKMPRSAALDRLRAPWDQSQAARKFVKPPPPPLLSTDFLDPARAFRQMAQPRMQICIAYHLGQLRTAKHRDNMRQQKHIHYTRRVWVRANREKQYSFTYVRTVYMYIYHSNSNKKNLKRIKHIKLIYVCIYAYTCLYKSYICICKCIYIYLTVLFIACASAWLHIMIDAVVTYCLSNVTSGWCLCSKLLTRHLDSHQAVLEPRKCRRTNKELSGPTGFAWKGSPRRRRSQPEKLLSQFRLGVTEWSRMI